MRSPRVYATLCLLFLFFTLATARITEAACFGNDCLQFGRNSTGGMTLWFMPDATRTHGLANTRCASPGLDRIVSIHADGVQRGEIPPIAYWNTLSKQWLGGVNWSVHEWQIGLEAGVIAACFTGQHVDDQSKSVCYISTGDDDLPVPKQQYITRPICGGIHPTKKFMRRNWVSKLAKLYFSRQSGHAKVKWDWYVQQLAPWMPLVHHERVLIRSATRVKAFQVNHTMDQTEDSVSGHEVTGHEAPRRVRLSICHPRGCWV